MPLRGGKMNLVVLSWLGVACGVHRPPEATERADPLTEVRGFAATVADRGATLPASDPWDPTPTHVRYLDQGWGPVETLWYYYADQGSRLVRRDVLMHLEAADGQGPFVSDATFTRFRFLTQARTPNNPDGLPVGVTRDGAYVGLTCAACHTGQIVYGDAAIRVDGAPALIDLIGFIDALEASVRATLSNPDRLARFVAAVGAASADDQAAARLELERALAFLDSYSANFEQVAGGFGRIDAIGGIIAQVVRDTSGSGHAPPANAPASYPLLWDAPRHDYVQWAGFSSNAGPGSLARNVGEVVGVFGEVHVTARTTRARTRPGSTRASRPARSSTWRRCCGASSRRCGLRTCSRRSIGRRPNAARLCTRSAASRATRSSTATTRSGG